MSQATSWFAFILILLPNQNYTKKILFYLYIQNKQHHNIIAMDRNKEHNIINKKLN